MKSITMNGGRRPPAPIGGRSRRVALDGSHLRVLLATAALLLAVALGLEDRVLSWVQGSAPARLSAYEDHYLQEVRHLLATDQLRRTQAAGEPR